MTTPNPAQKAVPNNKQPANPPSDPKVAPKETPKETPPLKQDNVEDSQNNNTRRNKMAEVDTMMLADQHNDIRKEAVDHTNEIVREGLKGDYNTLKAIDTNRYDLTTRIENATDRVSKDVDNVGDRLTSEIFDISRDTADLRAQVLQVASEVKMVGDKTAKDTEIAVLKNTIDNQKNTQYLSDKITSEGDKTRELINSHKYDDLSRALIERNSELVEERGRGWRYHDHWSQAQFASLQSQLQAFNSQLQETRQGMVNFGTMAGVGQSSTSNNVR